MDAEEIPSPGAGHASTPGAAPEFPVRASMAPRDLSKDKLLLAAPRMELQGRPAPALAGIPLWAKIGQGGMGAVYYGVHPRLQKEVAIKVLPFHLAEQQPDLIQRFFREAQIAARIQSPHLVNVLDVNEEEGLFYLVMEYVRGCSAGGYLKRVKAMGKVGAGESVALEICIAATEGLAVAHAQHITHRDIKPDNILVPRGEQEERLRFGAAKLADLGLARGEDAGQTLTGTQVQLGTPGYMAPEQALDARNAKPAVDVFGMGATLYALLSGHAPFTGTSATKVMMDTVQQPHRPIRDFRPEVSEASARLLDRCLAKDPAQRYPDATALLPALKACRNALGEPAKTLLGKNAAEAAASFMPPTQAASAFLPGSVPPPTPSPSRAPPSTPVPDTTLQGLRPAAAPPPQRPRGRFVRAAALLLLLAGGAYGFWTWREGRPRQEIARALTEARASGSSRAELQAALQRLEAVKRKYGGRPALDWGELRALRAALEKRLEEARRDEELSEKAAQAAALAEDSQHFDEALALLRDVSARHAGAPSAALSKVQALARRLEERRARQRVAQAISRARASAQDPAKWAEALAALDQAGKEYGSQAGAERKNLAAFREELSAKLAEREIARALAWARKQARDPTGLSAAQERLQALESRFSGRPARELAGLRALLNRLETRQAALSKRKERFAALLKEAGRQASTDPAAALKKLNEAEELGRANTVLEYPDLLGALQPDLASRRKEIARLAQNQVQKAEEARNTRRKKKFEAAWNKARQAREKDWVFVKRTLSSALKDLGTLDHPGKKAALELLKKADGELRRKADYETQLKEALDFLARRKWRQAQAAFQKAAQTWGAETIATKKGLKDAKDGAARAAYDQAIAEARRAETARRWSDARRACQKALKIRPQAKEAAEMLARARRAVARTPKAPPSKPTHPATPVTPKPPAPPKTAFGPPRTYGPFGVYANRRAQGVPLDRKGRVIPLRTDLDKEQYEQAMRPFRKWLLVPKGAKVRVEAHGKWYSGPTGSWVGPDGKRADGRDTLKNFRAFKGPKNRFNIAMLVIFISTVKKPGSVDFKEAARRGHVWGYTDKKRPVEFIMPASGPLRFQQNRDGYYDVTQGALRLTVSVSLPLKK